MTWCWKVRFKLTLSTLVAKYYVVQEALSTEGNKYERECFCKTSDKFLFLSHHDTVFTLRLDLSTKTLGLCSENITVWPKIPGSQNGPPVWLEPFGTTVPFQMWEFSFWAYNVVWYDTFGTNVCGLQEHKLLGRGGREACCSAGSSHHLPGKMA